MATGTNNSSTNSLSLNSVTVAFNGYSSGWNNKSNIGSKTGTTSSLKLESVDFSIYLKEKVEKPEEVKPASNGKKAFASITTETYKNVLKDIFGNISSENVFVGLWGLAATAFGTSGAEILGSWIKGEKINWTKVGVKTSGKVSAGTLNFAFGFFSKKVGDDGKVTRWAEKGLDKMVITKITREKDILKMAWEGVKNDKDFAILNTLKIKPTDAITPKTAKILIKNKAARIALRDARKGIYEEFIKETFHTNVGMAVKEIGGQIGGMVMFDYGMTILGTGVFTAIIEHKSLGDAFASISYGQELLKSVNKTVFAYAGRLIGYALLSPKAGEVIGTVVGVVINNWICEGFRDPHTGIIDDKACAIAAGAELAGAVGGGFAAVVLLSNPAGWAVGVCILVGASLAYEVVYTVFHLKEYHEITIDVYEKFDEELRDRYGDAGGGFLSAFIYYGSTGGSGGLYGGTW